MQQDVFVSGYGIISALGFNSHENAEALRAERSGIGHPKYLKTNHHDTVLGEVKASSRELAEMANLPFRETTSRTIFLGILAAREAIVMAGLTTNELNQAGLINGTTVGGMDISEKAYRKVLAGEKVDLKRMLYGHDCGHSTQQMAKLLAINGYSSTISTACSSSANTIMQGARLIKSGQLKLAIAGGTDALSLFTLNGFNSLKILDSEWCQPFDKHRRGLNLGEGSAYLVLESEASLKERGARPIAKLSGYGNSNDAHHQTASSPEGRGATMAMEKTIAVSGVQKSMIDYVNAHGTGTENNDLSESIALANVFGGQIPAYSSTKAYTGHTLAAAGVIEAVISVLSISRKQIYPSLNIKELMKAAACPVQVLTERSIDHVLSNSFGFGGNCTSLLFSRS